MDIDKYKALTNKRPIKTKPRTRPLPKEKEKYLEAEENFEHALNIFGIKYEKQFHFKSTKHWRFDFHLIEHRILVEISGGPWSGGRGGKLKNKAWSLDRYDDAEAMGFRVVRLESAPSFKDIDLGPLQIKSHLASQWLKSLKGHIFNGTDQTIPTDGSH